MDCGNTPCENYAFGDAACYSCPWRNDRAYGGEDYFETHNIDDYREFEDNEAWNDMLHENDDWGEWE